MASTRRSSNGVQRAGIEALQPAAGGAAQDRGAASVVVRDGTLPEATTEEAAKVLVEQLFAQNHIAIPGISYAVSYRLAEGPTGGDIVDLYQYDNDSIALSIADISGKGPHAAVNAALIKFGLRAYSSEGLTPERVIRAMDRLYLENTAFEKLDSFASVFFGIVDPTRRLMTYTNAGHEPVIVVFPDGTSRILNPTAPLVGVFDDQHHLFRQAFVDLPPGTLFRRSDRRRHRGTGRGWSILRDGSLRGDRDRTSRVIRSRDRTDDHGERGRILLEQTTRRHRDRRRSLSVEPRTALRLTELHPARPISRGRRT